MPNPLTRKLRDLSVLKTVQSSLFKVIYSHVDHRRRRGLGFLSQLHDRSNEFGPFFDTYNGGEKKKKRKKGRKVAVSCRNVKRGPDEECCIYIRKN